MNRHSDFSLRLWVATSWVGGAAAALCLFAAACALQSPDDVRKILLDWQTLLAGILALAGAVLTVYGLAKQVQVAQAIEREKVRRRHLSDRAALPLALVQLTAYLRLCVSLLEPLNPPSGASQRIVAPSPYGKPVPLNLPADAIKAIRDNVESAEQDESSALSQLIAELQIQNSRFNSFFEDISPNSAMIVVTHNLHGRIFDALQLEAACRKMFDYARLRSDAIGVDLSAHDIFSCAFNAGIMESDFEGVYEMISRNHNRRILSKNIE